MSAGAGASPGEPGAGTSLEREVRRLCAVIEARRRYLDTLRGLMDALHRPPGDAETLARLETALDAARGAVDAENGSLLALEEESGELVFVIARGTVPGDKLSWRRLPSGEGVAAWVARNARPCIVNDAADDDRFFPAVDAETGYRTRSLLAVPMIREGRVLGVLELVNKRDGLLFTSSDESRLMLLAHLGAELLARMG